MPKANNVPRRAASPEYTYPLATVDIVLFTIVDGELNVLVPRREQQPFAGTRALVGGYVHVDEDADALATARRILSAKVSLTEGYFIEQLATFSGPARDPRGWSISIAYYAVVPMAHAQPSEWFVPISRLMPLPFDHDRIVATALERIRGKASYSTLPAFLLPATFTMTELQAVYEHVMGAQLDRASFRRKIESQEFIEEVPGELRRGTAFRPSQLYRLRAATLQQFDRII